MKYQFTGQEYDESALHNYRARLYDSDLGKFYAVDPAGQGWSLYAYAGNNPVIIVDRDGRIAWFVPIIIGAAINSVIYAATTDDFSPQGLLGAAVSGGIAGGLAVLAPAGIIPGAAWGAGTGAFANAVGAYISGTDMGQAVLWGAAGGFIGGGISGGLQAHALGRNILTGKAPQIAPAPIPLSAPAGDIPIRGGGQTTTQGLVDAPDVVPTGGSASSGKSWPWRPAQRLNDIEQIQG
ncbi:MAG: RHS repeat-associated core domain-containing protein, partial [Nitrososphaera sp.]